MRNAKQCNKVRVFFPPGGAETGEDEVSHLQVVEGEDLRVVCPAQLAQLSSVSRELRERGSGGGGDIAMHFRSVKVNWIFL